MSNESLVIFEFADSTTRSFTKTESFIGIRDTNGNRPIRAYTNKATPHMLYIMQPQGEIHKMYIKQDKYLIKENIPVELVKQVFSDTLYIPLGNGQHMEYNAYYDGPTLDREEAIKLFPEYFV